MKTITIVVCAAYMTVHQVLHDPKGRAKLWFKGAGFECYVWAQNGVNTSSCLAIDKIRHLALLEAQEAHIPMMTITDFGRYARRVKKVSDSQLSFFDDHKTEVDYD